MAGKLAGQRVAFLAAPEGTEQVELTEPWQAVRSEGGEPVLVSLQPGEVVLFHHLDKARTCW
jgi:protease I